MKEKIYGQPLNVDIPEPVFAALDSLNDVLGLPKKRLVATAIILLTDMNHSDILKAYQETCERFYSTETKKKKG